MFMNKKSVIDFLAFFVPAILSYALFSYGDMAERIGYAIAIGAAFFLPIAAITRGADESFRKTASTSDKVNLLLTIICFPVIYMFISDFYARTQDSGRCMRAWVTLIVTMVLLLIITKISEYIIKLFER